MSCENIFDKKLRILSEMAAVVKFLEYFLSNELIKIENLRESSEGKNQR